MKVPTICPVCGGDTKPGSTTFVADISTGVVVVRNVKATICSQCGEDWIDPETARQIERIVENARERKEELAVVRL